MPTSRTYAYTSTTTIRVEAEVIRLAAAVTIPVMADFAPTVAMAAAAITIVATIIVVTAAVVKVVQEEQEEQEDGGALPGGPLKMGVVMAQAMDSPGQAPFGRQPVAATAADGNSDVITPIYVPIVCLNERKGGVFVTCIM